MHATDRRSIAQEAGRALAHSGERVRGLRLGAGFDAVVDSIIDVVDAHTDGGYRRIETIDALARRIAAASGRSANLELFVRRRKVGGNACNLAQAAITLGAGLTLLANVSDEHDPRKTDPILRVLTDRCRRVITLGPPGATDALEFRDGKIMLGKTAALDAITWEGIVRAAGGEGSLAGALAGLDAMVTANWTMTRAMNGVWAHMASYLLPSMRERDRPARLFVDLADPAKRSDDDLRAGIEHLRAINALVPVALGLNLAEAGRLATIVGAPSPDESAMTDAGALRAAAESLGASLGLHVVILHSRYGSASSGAGEEGASFSGPFTRAPMLSTGAGDHFNAGWLIADRLGLAPVMRLAVASAVAGLYVRTGESPALSDVADFLADLPEPEPA